MIDRPRRWTSQRWFGSVLIAMVVLIGTGAVVGTAALARTTAVSNRLSDHIAPARTAVAQLDAALVNQETGVRGFLLSGEDQFLDPYEQGRADAGTAAAEVRRLLADEPDALADLTAVEEQAGRWRSDAADRLIRQRRTGGPSAVSLDAVTSSKAQFDAVRGRLDTLQARLVKVREVARADLTRSRDVRDVVFTVLVLSLLLLIAVMAVLLRVVVLRPLARLGGAVRRVADGDFEHRLVPDGPADLAQLGRDVEAMRLRLVRSLAESQQQRLELERSNADLEQFAYVASHDLQEPLRKVASFCQMLQRRYAGSLDDRAQQYIAFAVDGATRMQTLITDLLSFSRIGRVYNTDQPVDLDKVLDEVEQTLALAVEESGAEVTRPALPTVRGDLTLLTMLWQNLLGNAIKFRRPDVPPRVTVTAEEGDGVWTFSVRDNGIGIEPEYAEKIFVIFQRLHPRQRYSGTGIGLALCKKIVEHHGGRIWLGPAADDDPGATLIFTLPTGS